MIHDYSCVLMPDELKKLEMDLEFIDRLITSNPVYALATKAARAYLDLRTEVACDR